MMENDTLALVAGGLWLLVGWWWLAVRGITESDTPDL